MRSATLLLLASLVLCLVGCQNPKGKSIEGHMPEAPIEPAPPPAQVKSAIDPALRAAADKELSASLTASDPMTRVHGLEGVRDSNGVQHKDEIVAALGDKESRVRFAAALAAGELKIAEARWPLLNIADDPSENVRVAVRFALHRLGYKELSHDLEHMATDPSPLVRGNTAFVLGMMGEPSAIKLLRALAQDNQPAVRQQAIEAMWRLGDDDALKDLVGMTMSGHPDDQMVAYLALAEPRNIKVRQHVRPGLVGEDSIGNDREKWMLSVPLVAARAMGMLGSDEGFGLAQKGAGSVDPQLRTLAALAFGAIGRSDAQETLRKLLSDADAGVRIAAATAILQLKSPA